MPFRFFNNPRGKIFLFATTSLFIGTALGQDSLAERELQRRQAAVQEGQILLQKGDEAYEAMKYEEAVAAYAGAKAAFPDAPGTKELKDAASQRYAQASVELGRELSRKGDVAGAKSVVEEVLDANDDSSTDVETEMFRNQLDDPIRTNPALSSDHAADVDEVRRGLYMAQGSFDLGKYDEAKSNYEKVLRLDPYNSAARRGMEKVAAQKSNYFGSAYDSTRAEFLAEVDGSWELPLAADLVIPDLPDVGEITNGGDFIPVSNKLSRIIVPEFRLEEATIMEAIDLVRLRAEENDTMAVDPRQKGINVTVNVGDATASPGKEILSKTFDLSLNNVPLEQILKYLAEITGTNIKKDEFAVTFVPSGFGADEMTARTYKVPPDFLSNLGSGGSNKQESEDIFNTDVGVNGVLAERMGAQEALEQQGVSFPDGASASLNSATNTLRVVNSVPNQDVIEQIVSSISLTEPVSVAVRVTMLKTQRTNLEELGFDWMLNNFEAGGNSTFGGARELNITGGTTGNGGAITDFPVIPGSQTDLNPITSGNRSGDSAIAGNSIDDLISSANTGSVQETNRAPGVIGLNGVVGNATIQALMRGLDQKKGSDLMAQPAVTTRSGQAASIEIVEEFIYPTEYEPPEIPTTSGSGTSAVTPATPTAFETRNVGITLEVLPVADANKQYVDVTLNSDITDFDGFVNFGSPINTTVDTLLGSEMQELTENAILMPIFSPTRVNSNLVVADGATIVIGGLQRDEITTVNDKTPILGDIPVVGRLFQSNVKSHSSTAIIFLVNVQILDPTGRPYKDR
ncbi:Amuc_1098 family type IV pilus outer membrane protein [Luteolibacter sp. AS25]|uniref:Amuc_1098 family type IV pilus outer membrane protein n=1 Tax=Luteolibacter sp. AS25 TaxID=3135776 RepID=UPI00398B93B2